MKSKMVINTHLSATESKKPSKQEEQRWNHGYREGFDGCCVGGGCGGTGEEVGEVRNTKR